MYRSMVEALSGYLAFHDDNIKEEYGKFRYMMFTLPIALRSKVIVETGLSQGFSTQIFCESAKLIGAKVFTYDIEDFPETREKIKQLGLDKVWVFVHKDSIKGGKEWIGEKIDLLFLDSNHVANHVKKELDAWTPHLSEKGLVLIHDTFNPEPEKRPDYALVGVREFVSENKGWFLMNLRSECGMAVMWRTEK